MNKTTFIILFFLLGISLSANDGTFYTNGNQLIPLIETDISIRKEILTLKKIRNQYIEVTVYYEFFNPKDEKKLTVGFEAFSPMGDADRKPINNHHPYIKDFTVELNGTILKHDVAIVPDSLYFKSGKIKSLDFTKYNDFDDDFFYVYHFDANFKKGLNIIKHTYSYNLSNSVVFNYDFQYILTTANRWSNKQIDDFTLVIDAGELEDFSINKTFFQSKNEWIINGIGISQEFKADLNLGIETDAVRFYIQRGNLIFQKKNFKINGDLFLASQNYNFLQNSKSLPFSYFQDSKINNPQTEFEKKCLKNLPFARRGYIFQNQELNFYFKKMDWYIQNPNYEPIIENLTEIEKKWIEKWK
jgi:hypothetical protein